MHPPPNVLLEIRDHWRAQHRKAKDGRLAHLNVLTLSTMLPVTTLVLAMQRGISIEDALGLWSVEKERTWWEWVGKRARWAQEGGRAGRHIDTSGNCMIAPRSLYDLLPSFFANTLVVWSNGAVIPEAVHTAYLAECTLLALEREAGVVNDTKFYVDFAPRVRVPSVYVPHHGPPRVTNSYNVRDVLLRHLYELALPDEYEDTSK